MVLCASRVELVSPPVLSTRSLCDCNGLRSVGTVYHDYFGKDASQVMYRVMSVIRVQELCLRVLVVALHSW